MDFHAFAEWCVGSVLFGGGEFGDVWGRWRGRVYEDLFEDPTTAFDGGGSCGIGGDGQDGGLGEQTAAVIVLE
jgi:hypothetical protein